MVILPTVQSLPSVDNISERPDDAGWNASSLSAAPSLPTIPMELEDEGSSGNRKLKP